jgi:tetratricopeptide (TPR) repeat protein
MSLLATSPGRAGSVGARPASEGGENGGLREHAPFHSPPADAAADTLVSRRGPEEKQSPPPRTLREALPGTLIAGRYRIIRFIAQGGMGEVYEAEDTELSERLALKTIRPELSRGELAIERFKREIHLARRVTHPNVCRIFDIGYHLLVQPPAGEQPRTGDSIIFLTMELLHGETLAARVARMGKLHPDEALFVAEQMAAGLGAAHRAGVVHRDFKSENVFLVPTAGTPSAAPGEPPIRVVITDFGVARATAQGGARLTTDEFIGSPAYMAPEQVEGKTVTAASDIYALGVVLYEAVTGALPFDGDSPLAVALARLREAPPPPRSKVPELPARWNDAVMKCLERDPAARPQSTEEVIADLTGEMPRWAVSGVTRSRVKAMERRRRIVLALVAVLALGGGVAAAWFAQGLLGGTSRSARARPTVAVLGFKNLSGKPDQAWLSTALAETLSAELGGSGSLRILPAESVARMRAELKLPDSAGLSRETLAKVRTNLGADLVVGGSYLALGEKAGGTIQLNVQVQDATGGSEDAQAIAESGSEARLLELVARAGKRLRGQLGAGELAAESAGAVAQQLPRGTDAARAYADGLARLRRWDHLGARASLEAAVKADPNHPLAHAYLARALARLGYEARAAEQAKKAFDLSGSLGKEEQLQIQAQLRESTKEWSKAAEVWRALWTFYPDNVEYGVELCRILYWAEKPQEALKVAAQLHALPGAAGLDPRIDLYEAQAWSALSDYPKQVAAAQKAARSAEANGQSALASRALSQQGWGLHDMGKNAEAKPLFEKELALCRAAGDKACEATADSNLGTIAEAVGDFEGAKADYQKALLVNREIGDLLAAAQTLNNLGSALHGQGRLAETRKVWEEALKLERERDEKSGVAMMSFNLGNLLMDMGDLAAAKKGYAEAGVLYRELGQKSGLAAVLFGEGNILFTEGDLAGARQKLDESRRTCEEIKFKLGASEATALLGDIAFSEGNFSEARRRMQEALERRQEMGDKARVADSKVNLAKLSIEDGRFDEAVKLASEAVAEFKAAKAPDREAFARAALAEAYLGAGKKDEAEKAAQEAAALLAPGQGVSARFEVGTIRARTKAASGKGLEAVKELEALVAEESRLGFYGDSLESRLRLGEAEISAGRASDGRTHLDALSREAKEKGFGRVARKAAAHGQKSG